MSNIFIFSRPIRTGKTTQLLGWSRNKPDMYGLLTPDVDGLRMLYDLVTKQYHPFQLETAASGPAISVGRFIFARESFATASRILLDAAQQSYNWLVIDEVGKLEIEQGQGLDDVVKTVIAQHRARKQNGRLLLVIRDTLLGKALEQYRLHDATILGDILPDE